MKAMDIESEKFPYLRHKILKTGEAKMKDGVSFGPKLHNNSKTKT